MKNLLTILLCLFLFGCSQESAKRQTTKPITAPTTTPNNLEIEKNLISLDNGKEENIQFVKTSLDYLTEHTTSTREEIADITNKIVPELNKDGVKCTREEFLFVCKSTMQMNNTEQKLGEKPDFAYLAASIAGGLKTNHK